LRKDSAWQPTYAGKSGNKARPVSNLRPENEQTRGSFAEGTCCSNGNQMPCD
jgi:hypothetical protein